MKALWNIPAKEVPANSGYIFEQYKLFHASIEQISDRRLSMNKFFITINTLFISCIAVLTDFIEVIEQPFLFVLFSFIGMMICYYWELGIFSYQKMNNVKFDILQEIEKKLPLNLYSCEWSLLKSTKTKNYFKSFTELEKDIPFLLIVAYFLLLTHFLSIFLEHGTFDGISTLLFFFSNSFH